MKKNPKLHASILLEFYSYIAQKVPIGLHHLLILHIISTMQLLWMYYETSDLTYGRYTTYLLIQPFIPLNTEVSFYIGATALIILLTICITAYLHFSKTRGIPLFLCKLIVHCFTYLYTVMFLPILGILFMQQ